MNSPFCVALRHQMTMLWEADESFSLWLKPAGHQSQPGRRWRKKDGQQTFPSSLTVSCATRQLRVGARAGVGWKTSVWGVVGTVLCRAGSSSGREDWPGRQSQGRCTLGEGGGARLWGGRGKDSLLVGEVSFSKNSESPRPALVHWLWGGLGCRGKISSGISPETRHT